MVNHDAERGRYIVAADESHPANVAVIGSDVAKRLFKSADPIGKTLYVDGEAFEVVGVGKELGSAFGQTQDQYVMIPVETYEKLYGSQRSLNVSVQALTPDLMDPAKDEARMLMRALHPLGAKEEDNFVIIHASAGM